MAKPRKPPDKPTADFPLFPHSNGQWAKKIKGKQYYFGLWDEPEVARQNYTLDKAEIEAGRPRLSKQSAQSTTPAVVEGSTPDDTRLRLHKLVNDFLNSKRRAVKSNELSDRMHHDYHGICEMLIEHLGRDRIVVDITAEDFENLRSKYAEGVGLVTRGNRIRMTRTVFKYGYDSDLLEHPIKFGPGFKMPAKKLLRAEKQKKPARMFEAEEIRTLLAGADPILKAMILIGVNCGYGQTDLSNVPKAAFDLKTGWLTFPRTKTAIERRCPLWKETVQAVTLAITHRPKAKRPEFDDRAFLTRFGVPYVRTSSTGAVIDGVAQQFRKLLIETKLHGNRRAFYALRHTFETIGGDARDQIPVDYIMGHSPASDDMSAEYRERITDDRLIAVANYVHKWLFPPKKTAKKKKTITN